MESQLKMYIEDNLPSGTNRAWKFFGRRRGFRPMSNWNALAELDPLWAVLSNPQKRFGKWDPVEFFGKGKREAERVLAMCKSNAVDVSYGKLLDFGCGVGRMTRAFAGVFTTCTGIDVSEKMVALARKFNSEQANCQFISSDSGVLPFADESFDFVFSVLVLQHIPRRDTILGYIAEFIRVATDKGVIVFQLPIEVPLWRRIQLRRRLWSWLASLGIPESWLFRKLHLAPIPINGISRQEIENFVRARGAKVQAVERYDSREGPFHSYYYFIAK
jgi:SAM-dependent methyltransferase